MDIYIYFFAFILDLIFKDIEIWPHPVRFIGFIINRLEKIVRSQNIVPLKIAGFICVFFVCIIVATIVLALISIPVVGLIFKLYFAYAGLSLGGLLEKGKEVLFLCKKDYILLSRKRLSYLVSRDTSNMEKKEILKGVAETLSENFNDGFVAPFFYLVLGGPVLLWIYKVISTFDSMWGYKTEKYRELGFAGAKLDDIFGFIPARISFFVIFLASFIIGKHKNLNDKIKMAISDAKKMESPNAGWPMAACAHLFERHMGGRTIYFGRVYEKPILGPEGEWVEEDIELLVRYLFLCGIFVTVIFLGIRIIL